MRPRSRTSSGAAGHGPSVRAGPWSSTLRPGYQALLAALRTGGIGLVLAESLDRFSRDQEHIAAFYKQASFADVRIVTLAEGDISELHVGLKGTMSALYLKDLSQKTRRGLEGRVLEGRSVGTIAYGYRMVRRLQADGEPDRGLREVDPVQAAVVRRIFLEYAGGASPLRIARALNAEDLSGPKGGIWYDSTIRGWPCRGDGLLRNELYLGRVLWGRRRSVKDPLTGAAVRRLNEPGSVIVQPAPDFQIIDQALWAQVQARLAHEQAAAGGAASGDPRPRF